MRIIGGEWKGRSIKSPEGSQTTRPTTDRVREALASIVLSRIDDLADARVLDAFAGSGALGLEMLSRGARSATLCERDRAALGCIRANVASLRIPESRVFVVPGDAFALAARGGIAGGPFDLVLLDPPYDTEADKLDQFVECLSAQGMLSCACLVIHQRASKGRQLAVPGIEMLATRRYGITCVDVLRRQA